MANFIYIFSFLYLQKALGLENRVYGGRLVPDGSQNHLVSLIIDYNDPQLCSGSIISPSLIITSAHCFNSSETAKSVQIFHQHKGNLNLLSKVKKFKIIIHPEWRNGEQNRDVDLALIKTRKKIKFNKLINPIKLSTTPPKVGQSAILAGFGDNDLKNAVGMATEAMVEIVECPGYLQSPTVICSNSIGRAGPGDSGGSLVLKGDLIGVTSASCDTYLNDQKCVTVYANVADNLEWISNNMA